MNKFDSLTQRLLKIKADSLKMSLLLFPPIYGLWIYALGKTTMQRHKFLFALFCVLTFITFFFLLYCGIGIPTLMAMKSPLANEITDLIIFPATLVWLTTSIVLTFATLDFEQTLLSDNNKRLTFSDYFLRFFVITNWWLGIWSYQKNVNTYLTVKESPAGNSALP